MRKLVVMFLIALTLSQEYLPKQGEIPWNDLLATNIARSGDSDFYKVDHDGWTTVISSYPVRPNAITKITF